LRITIVVVGTVTGMAQKSSGPGIISQVVTKSS
jgi:hypothetical protein